MTKITINDDKNKIVSDVTKLIC